MDLEGKGDFCSDLILSLETEEKERERERDGSDLKMSGRDVGTVQSYE